MSGLPVYSSCKHLRSCRYKRSKPHSSRALASLSSTGRETFGTTRTIFRLAKVPRSQPRQPLPTSSIRRGRHAFTKYCFLKKYRIGFKWYALKTTFLFARSQRAIGQVKSRGQAANAYSEPAVEFKFSSSCYIWISLLGSVISACDVRLGSIYYWSSGAQGWPAAVGCFILQRQFDLTACIKRRTSLVFLS